MSDPAVLTDEEQALVDRCRANRGVPVLASTLFYWVMFGLGAAVVLFGLAIPIARWASSGAEPDAGRLVGGLLGGLLWMGFWWGLARQAALTHRLACLVDKMARQSPAERRHAEPSAAADGGA